MKIVLVDDNILEAPFQKKRQKTNKQTKKTNKKTPEIFLLQVRASSDFEAFRPFRNV